MKFDLISLEQLLKTSITFDLMMFASSMLSGIKTPVFFDRFPSIVSSELLKPNLYPWFDPPTVMY